MGCVPVILTFTDARCTVVVLFWSATAVLLWYIATCSEAAEQRFFAFYVSLIGMSIYCLLLKPVRCLNQSLVNNNNNNNNNTVISTALFTDRPGALTTSDVCSTK